MMTLRCSLACALVAGALLAPAAAHADAADDLFRDGSALFNQNKLGEAYAKFLEAWKLKQSYDIAANLGIAERRLGKNKDAVEHLEFAIKNFPPSVDVAVLDAAKNELAAAKKEIGGVNVTCPERTQLFLNGKKLGETPITTIYLEPGTYELGAANKEKGGTTITLKVDKGQQLAVTLDLVPGQGPPLVDDGDGNGKGNPPAGEPFPLWPGLLVGGVGLAGIGAGIGVAIAAGSAGSEADELAAGLESRSACLANPKPEVCTTIQDDLESRDGLTAGAIAAFAVGGALVVGGVVLIAVSATSGGETASDEKPAGPAVTAIAPWFTAEAGGFVVGGTF